MPERKPAPDRPRAKPPTSGKTADINKQRGGKQAQTRPEKRK
jgi:hypothetical protein